MKRFLSLFLVLILLTTVVVGCTQSDDDTDKDEPEVDAPAEDDNEDEETAEVGEITKVGLGHVASIAKSEDADDDEDEPAMAQADLTIAAVGFDADDKVASVTIDTAQTKVEFDEDLKVATDKEEEVRSKKELKEDYGMKETSENVGIGKEWYEQMEALEDWMVGKTVEEITGMDFKENGGGYEDAPDVAELTSSVTISVTGYLEALENAWENAIDVENGAKVGLGLTTSIEESKDAEDDEGPLARMDTTMTATAFDEDDKVVGTIIDTAQIAVEYDTDGKVTSDKDAEIKTKHELKEDYDMKETSENVGIGKEWYEQMEALQDWMVGKSVDEITGMDFKENGVGYEDTPDVAELTSSVTISVTDYLSVVEYAA